MERLTMRNSDGTYSQPTHTTFEKMFYKLAELEDLMEKYNVENLESLDKMLSILSGETRHQINKIQQENTELKKKLENAIVLPEIKKGQKIYCLREYKLNHLRTGYFQKWNNEVWADVIFDPKEVTDEDGYTYVDFDFDMVDINAVFITKQEAEQRLKELKGE